MVLVKDGKSAFVQDHRYRCSDTAVGFYSGREMGLNPEYSSAGGNL